MPTLLVRHEAGVKRLRLRPGQSVREALDLTELRVRAACGGTGACGACTVHVLEGATNLPTPAECLKLPLESREAGLRLACQLRPAGDLEIALSHPAPPASWTTIPEEDLVPLAGGQPDLARHRYGLAVDLGTTHLRVALWDRKHGRRIGARRGLNPQCALGADVLTRLEAFRSDPKRAAELTALARNAVLSGLRDILHRDLGEGESAEAAVGRVVIAGNTAMLALLTGIGVDALLEPEGWQRPIPCTPAPGDAWWAAWNLPAAEIVAAPSVAGFIGSDLLADLIASDLTSGPPGSMLMDLGTNTEIALWDGRLLHVTSVPGGPAFEGAGMPNGMPAEEGAVCRVTRAAQGYALEVLGGGAPRGICGTGLLDAIALLVADGGIKPSGRLTRHAAGADVLLDPSAPRTGIGPTSIDAFQRAKAATAAAAAELLRLAGMDWADIPRLCVSGSFGLRLDVQNAQGVGLLPGIPPERIELFADAALAGCERALLEADSESPFTTLAASSRAHNVACVQGYEERFVEYLHLRPIPSVADPEDRCSTRSFGATTRR